MAVCITHPIDQTKIRSQTQKVRQNVWNTAKTSIQYGGVSGLWTGLSASLLRQCTYGAARFGIYAWLKEKTPRAPLWFNGAIAGVVAGIVGAPAGRSNAGVTSKGRRWLTSISSRRGRTGANVLGCQQAARAASQLSQLDRWFDSDLPRGRPVQHAQRLVVDFGKERRHERQSTVMASPPSLFVPEPGMRTADMMLTLQL